MPTFSSSLWLRRSQIQEEHCHDINDNTMAVLRVFKSSSLENIGGNKRGKSQTCRRSPTALKPHRPMFANEILAIRTVGLKLLHLLLSSLFEHKHGRRSRCSGLAKGIFR